MKTSTIILFALCATAVFAEETWGFKEEEDVIVATTDTWDEMLAKHDHILVEFYAPWCGHCKKLAPEYSQAAAVLKKMDPPVPLAKVDATIEKDLATRFSVQGFPTLKWFVKGQDTEYKGGRTKSEIIDWISKKTGPPTRLLADQAAVDGAKTDNKVVVTYYGAESDAEYGVYTTVAATTENVVFTHVFDADLVAAAGAKVVLYKQFDEGVNKIEGEMNAGNLKEFIETNRYEIVMPFEGEDPINRIFQQENSALILFSDAAGEHEATYAAFAKENRGKIIFAQSRTNDGLGQRLAEYIGVKAEDAPCVRLIHPASGDLSKFIFDGEINNENLNAFLTKWETGSLERIYKSADIPATNDEPVKVIVGKNFDDLVKNSGKDVLLEFYAPWCGHCKTLAPKYDEAAAMLAHMSDKLTLAKIDATENEVPGVSVQGFPTLKFWKAGNATPIEYDGAREVDGIIEWLKKNVSFEWSEPSAVETDL